ncbi:MAG: hypothetical protein F4X66_18460 [Chloroflexi bacterium]|nr:hypothetical protein [Chloroflexota bacterium]MYE41880.1 hypothetical protein [Chloroflexota bacterium]
MKTIRISVDEETHERARLKAAENETTVEAMIRGLLTEHLQPPSERDATEPERRAKYLDEILARFERKGVGIDTSQIPSREELYNRNASR